MELRRQHGHDGVDDVVHRQGAAENVSIAAIAPLEKCVAQDHDVIFVRVFETQANARADIEDMKEIPGGASALDAFRFDHAGDVEVRFFVTADRFELRRAFLPFDEIAQRDRNPIRDQRA